MKACLLTLLLAYAAQAAVSPFIVCHADYREGWLVILGYNNTGAEGTAFAVPAVELSDPKDNEVILNGEEVTGVMPGQPLRFFPGYWSVAFIVEVSQKSSISWTLDGQTVSLSSKDADFAKYQCKTPATGLIQIANCEEVGHDNDFLFERNIESIMATWAGEAAVEILVDVNCPYMEVLVDDMNGEEIDIMHPYELLSRFLLSLNNPTEDGKTFNPEDIAAGTIAIIPEPDGKIPIAQLDLRDITLKKVNTPEKAQPHSTVVIVIITVACLLVVILAIVAVIIFVRRRNNMKKSIQKSGMMEGLGGKSDVEYTKLETEGQA